MSTIPSHVSPALVPPRSSSSADLGSFALAASKKIGIPALRASVKGAASGAGVRVFTITVKNSSGQPATGTFLVLAWVADTVGGPPTAPDTMMLVTAPDGTAQLNVTAAAGQQRAVHAVVLGVADSSELETF